MRLRNMLKICLVFWESEPQNAYKKTCMALLVLDILHAVNVKDHNN